MRVAIGLLTLLGLPAAAEGQEAAPQLPQGFSLGATVDRYYIDGGHLTAASLRGVELRASRVTTEFGVGLILSRDDGGPTVLVTDLGAAYSVPVAGMHLLPHVGPTLAVTVGQREGAAAIGAYAGVGLVARLAGRLGIRADFTRRWFVSDGSVAGNMISAGVMLLPRPTPAGP